MIMVLITFALADRSQLLVAASPSPKTLNRETKVRASASQTFLLLVLALNNRRPRLRRRRQNNRRKRLPRLHLLRRQDRQEVGETSAGARLARPETDRRRAQLKHRK